MTDEFHARLRISDDLRRHGFALPDPTMRVGPAVVTARCPGGCRLVRAWAHPDGWRIVVEGGRVPADDWQVIAQLAPATDGAASPRHMTGAELVVPRGPAAWRDDEVLTGCKHGAGYASVAPLADALADVLGRGRAPAARPVTLVVRRASRS